MLSSVLFLLGLALCCGIILNQAKKYFHVVGNPVAEKIDNLLPQTQCAQCGYPGCKPYAEAIATNNAEINLCPPGGEELIRKLADLLNREYQPLDPAQGIHKPKTIAYIDEDLCIGCKLCIQACPVDAILGAAKHMHTVIRSECTGCELCLPPCPVDCIYMQNEATQC